MNILFVDQYSDLGGAQQCLLDLIPAIRQAGWTATCTAPGDGALSERLRVLGTTFQSLPPLSMAAGAKRAADFVRFTFAVPRFARHISRAARETRADLLYVNGPRMLPVSAWVARQTGIPLLFHVHNHLAQSSAAALAGRSLQLARARVIACCRYAGRPLWPYIDPGRLRVIYNGVAPSGRAVPASPASIRSIGIIGRVSPEKGQLEFIRAARLIAQSDPSINFTVCGAPLFADRHAARYFDQVRRAAEGMRVEFTGWQDDVSATLGRLDVLVVPSLREPGAPRVVLEAYAARIPVVAFVSGGIPEIVRDGETGFLVEPPTAQALAARLQQLLAAPERLHHVAETAYATWREEFTLARYQREVLEVIGLTQTRPAAGLSI